MVSPQRRRGRREVLVVEIDASDGVPPCGSVGVLCVLCASAVVRCRLGMTKSSRWAHRRGAKDAERFWDSSRTRLVASLRTETLGSPRSLRLCGGPYTVGQAGRAVAGGGAQLGFVASKPGSFMRQKCPIRDIAGGGRSGGPARGRKMPVEFPSRPAAGRASPRAAECLAFRPGRERRPATAGKMGWRPRHAARGFPAPDRRNQRESPARRGVGEAISGNFPVFRGHFRFSGEFPERFRRRPMSHDGT